MLKDSSVIVAGAASGIGRALCVELMPLGARISAADIDMSGLERLRRDARAAEEHAPLLTPCDVRREEDVAALVQRTLHAHGRIDALVMCAGILRPSGSAPKPLVDVEPEEWDAVIDTNLRGTFLCNRAVLPDMIARRAGHIINLSSTSGRQGRALDGPYCASKFGVIGLSEALAEEVRSYGIRVHTLLPDAVATPMWDQNGPIAAPADALPPGRVAEFIVYLLSLPADTVLVNPVIAPFRTRRRVKRTTAPELAASETPA